MSKPATEAEKKAAESQVEKSGPSVDEIWEYLSRSDTVPYFAETGDIFKKQKVFVSFRRLALKRMKVADALVLRDSLRITFTSCV